RIYGTFTECGQARHHPTCTPGVRVPIEPALDRAVWPLAGNRALAPRERTLARRWRAGSLAAARRRVRVGTRAMSAAEFGCGAGGRTRERDRYVTTMSSAEPTRRDFLYIATGAVATVGAVATLVPLIAQMNPDASTIAAGAPIEVDLTPIADGQVIKV